MSQPVLAGNALRLVPQGLSSPSVIAEDIYRSVFAGNARHRRLTVREDGMQQSPDIHVHDLGMIIMGRIRHSYLTCEANSENKQESSR